MSVNGMSEGLFKDKGSRFISYAYPISSADQVKPLVDALKKEHHAARHCCFAFRLGNDGMQFRANDDGEPSGSAGRPILAAIDSALLSDVLVVVVRYFGGILLGVPGLVRAYRTAAADALQKAETVVKTAADALVLEFDYEQTQYVMGVLRSFEGIRTVEQNFDLRCCIKVLVPRSKKESFVDKINSINDEKGTCIQCGPLQAAPERD